MYVPTTAISYVRYGDQLADNILQTLPSGAANVAVSLLMTTHLVSGVVIVLNPVTQEMEHVLAIPDRSYNYVTPLKADFICVSLHLYPLV